MQFTSRAGQQLSSSVEAEKGASCGRDMLKLWSSDPLSVEEKEGEKQGLSKITTKMKRHVRHVLKDENPTAWVGKDGFTPEVAKEIEKQLERNKMVKVRILKTALQTETAKVIASRAAEQTDASLVEVRGHVFILYRRRKKQVSI